MRSASRPSSTSTSSRSRTSLSSSIQSWRFTASDLRADRVVSQVTSSCRHDVGHDVRSRTSAQVSTSRCSSPSAGTSTRSSGASSRCSASAVLLLAARAGRRPAGPRRAPARAGGGRPGPTRTAPSRPSAASRSRRKVVRGEVRHVAGQHRDRPARVEQRVAAGEQRGHRAAVPRVLAGEGHRPVGRHRVADHDHLGGVDHGVERPGEQGPAVQLDRRLVGAVEPGGRAAGQHHRAERARSITAPVCPHCRSSAPDWQLDVMSMLSVAVVQEASGLDPAANRARLRDLVPTDSDLVVLPEAFARDFGEAGSDVSPYAEALDGAVRDRAGRGRRGAQHHRRRRDVRDLRGPRPALQHPAGPRRRDGGVPQDPPLRLLRLPRVRRAHAGPARAGGRRRRRLPASG